MVGGKPKENEKESKKQQLNEKLPCIIEAHHGLLTILKITLGKTSRTKSAVFLDTQVSVEPTPVSQSVSQLVRWSVSQSVGQSVGHTFGFSISGH